MAHAVPPDVMPILLAHSSILAVGCVGKDDWFLAGDKPSMFVKR